MENSYLENINTYTEDIWNNIEEFVLAGLNPNQIVEKTGIPAALIKDTVQDQLARRLNGGQEILDIAIKKGISKKRAIDIIYACRGYDGLSVDTKKAKKFLSYFVAQDNTSS